jgi:hypothetical protein
MGLPGDEGDAGEDSDVAPGDDGGGEE